MSEENNSAEFPSEEELTKLFGVEPKLGPSNVAYDGIGIKDGFDMGSCSFSLDYSSGECSISYSDACSWMPDCETHIASRIWIDWEAEVLFIEWAKREPGSDPAAISVRFPRMSPGRPLRTTEPEPKRFS